MHVTAGPETRKMSKVVWYSPGVPATPEPSCGCAYAQSTRHMLRLNAVIDAKESVGIRQQFAWLPMALLGIL